MYCSTCFFCFFSKILLKFGMYITSTILNYIVNFQYQQHPNIEQIFANTVLNRTLHFIISSDFVLCCCIQPLEFCMVYLHFCMSSRYLSGGTSENMGPLLLNRFQSIILVLYWVERNQIPTMEITVKISKVSWLVQKGS